MNSLPGGVEQRPHRHNSVAVSLVIEGARCFSVIDGRRKDLAPWATTMSPPVAVHSHCRSGNERALFLINQDRGINYDHTRAMGFAFAEHPVESLIPPGRDGDSAPTMLQSVIVLGRTPTGRERRD
jgi:gentisate 1,2-dioxygenase